MIIELGDLVSGQELEVCIRLKFPLGEVGETHQVAATLDRLDDLFGDGTMFATFTYADHASNDEQPRTREVDREVGRVYAARARAEATEANRHGDFARARRALVDTSRHISDYAADDAELTGMAEALREDVARFAEERMDPLSLKSAFMVAESGMSYREDDGKARRARPR